MSLSYRLQGCNRLVAILISVAAERPLSCKKQTNEPDLIGGFIAVINTVTSKVVSRNFQKKLILHKKTDCLFEGMGPDGRTLGPFGIGLVVVGGMSLFGEFKIRNFQIFL